MAKKAVIGELAVELNGKLDRLTKSFDDAKKAADRAGRDVADSFATRIENRFTEFQSKLGIVAAAFKGLRNTSQIAIAAMKGDFDALYAAIDRIPAIGDAFGAGRELGNYFTGATNVEADTAKAEQRRVAQDRTRRNAEARERLMEEARAKNIDDALIQSVVRMEDVAEEQMKAEKERTARERQQDSNAADFLRGVGSQQVDLTRTVFNRPGVLDPEEKQVTLLEAIRGLLQRGVPARAGF